MSSAPASATHGPEDGLTYLPPDLRQAGRNQNPFLSQDDARPARRPPTDASLCLRAQEHTSSGEGVQSGAQSPLDTPHIESP